MSNNYFVQALIDVFGADGAELIARRVGARFGGLTINLREKNKSPGQIEFEIVFYAAIMEHLEANNAEIKEKMRKMQRLATAGNIYIPTRGAAKKLPPRPPR